MGRPEPGGDVAEYVLSNFAHDEMATLEASLHSFEDIVVKQLEEMAEKVKR